MVAWYPEKSDCCGCSACYNICTAAAIVMEADAEGFLYPVIDAGKCVHCMKCREVCPLVGDYCVPGNLAMQEIYAVKHKDETVRAQSSSGGLFSALSDKMLDLGGVVYGAVFDPSLKVCHARATTTSERDPMRGSKYVQSELNEIFKQVLADLMVGRWVLFTGTPCQNAGLSAFLGTRYERLVLCDFACHSVSSPQVFADYLASLDEQPLSLSFRDKTNGWHNGMVKLVFRESTRKIPHAEDSFMGLFFRSLISRPSCHKCKFANLRRPSDITMADFWGVEYSRPHLDDNKGISLAILNSERGKAFFEQIKGLVSFERIMITEAMQRSFVRPTPISPERSLFFREYFLYGFSLAARRRLGPPIARKIKRMITSIFRGNNIFGNLARNIGRIVRKIR